MGYYTHLQLSDNVAAVEMLIKKSGTLSGTQLKQMKAGTA